MNQIFLAYPLAAWRQYDNIRKEFRVFPKRFTDFRKMSHLESLIAEYLEWQGYLIRQMRKSGGEQKVDGRWNWMLVGYHPKLNKITHYEPSIDDFH
jgi:hypothetical protein